MKHIILFISICLAIVASGFSQVISIKDKNGKDLTNQSTTFYIDQRKPFELSDLFLVNQHGYDIRVMVRKREIRSLSGSKNSISLINSQKDFDQSFSVNYLLIPAYQASKKGDFSIEYFAEGLSGSSVITYEFYSPDVLLEPVTLTVTFVSGSFSASSFEVIPARISDPRPNPARDFTFFDYTLPHDARNARLVVRNLTGTIVLEIPMPPAESRIKVETNSLSNGVYLYSFMINDQVVLTRKLVISR